jgi:hypothetical protein
MKRSVFFALFNLFVLSAGAARAEEVAMLSVQDALNSPAAAGKINGSVKFYFGGSRHRRSCSRTVCSFPI